MSDDEKFPAEQLADQADLFAAFTGVKKTVKPQDRIFLVMGMTGSGKSTFINRCTGKDVTVGHSLYSCKCGFFLLTIVFIPSAKTSKLQSALRRHNLFSDKFDQARAQ